MLAQRIGRDLVHMRACLPRGMRAVPVMLHKAGGGAEAAIFKDWQNREAAAREIRHQQVGIVRADADAAGSQQSGVACSACNPAHLAKILASVASLPIMVVQPLPIGEDAAAIRKLRSQHMIQ